MSGAHRDATRVADATAAPGRAAEPAVNAPPAEVLTAIVAEAGELRGVSFAGLLRFEHDGSSRIVALHNAPSELSVGDRWPLAGDGIVQRVFRSRRTARVESYAGVAGPDADRACRLGVRASAGAPVLIAGRLWGVLAAATSSPAAVRGLEPRLEEFAERAVARIAATHATTALRGLADEQAALRRVAELVAVGASQSSVFDAVADEACRLLGGHFTALLCYEPEGPAVIVSMHGADAVKHVMHVGMRLAAEGDGLVQRVQRTAQAVRVDNYTGVPGWNAATARDLALTSGVGAPIVTEGRVWGAITVLGSGPPLPENAEARLEMFAKLVATAISNAQARINLANLGDEQTALRRVAELVARGVAQEELFDTVTVEASRLVDNEPTTLVRIDDSTAYTVLAACGGPATVGTRTELAPDDEGIIPGILRTRRPARLDDYGAGPGLARAHADYGVGSAVGVPIILEGQVWGILAATTVGRLPPNAESRLGQFADLVAIALTNVRMREEIQQLADEQAALRRVAELVARGVPPPEVFAAVATEASRLVDGEAMTLTRFEGEHELVVVATCHGPAPIGTDITFADKTLPDWLRRENRVVRVDDYMRERDAELAAQFGLAAAVAAPISVEGEVWGMLTATSGAQPLPRGTEHRLQQFAKLVAAALAHSQARDELHALADEQAALRRIAELVARDAPADDVLEAVAVQASQLAGVDFTTLLRFEPDGSTEIVALDGAPEAISVGMRASGSGDGAVQRVWRTGRAARIDNLTEMSGPRPKVAAGVGFSASAAVPIPLERRLWGALVVVARNDPLPREIERHLTDFAELASTAISAAEARRELHMLVEEHAALRRVAELVARGAALEEVFAAVATEASNLLGEIATALLRYDRDDVAVVVAVCSSPAPLGLRIPAGTDTGTGEVRRTGRPARVDTYAGTALAGVAKELGVGAGVVVPVMVEGRVWGALTTSTPGPPLPVGTEERLMQFAELAAAAIANAENKANLTASRARVVATADEARRRLQRDLHDGAQQRLVHTLITLRRAKDAAADDHPAGGLIDEALDHTERANRELRNLVRGMLPASLTRGGLLTAVESLVSDIAISVDIDVTTPRLPAPTETTAYFIVAEALTNVVKHADASHATVEIRLQAHTLSIEVRDDGLGGANPAHGTGLTGLLDRIEASNGTLTITSPPQIGTTLHATLPLSDVRAEPGPNGQNTISE